MKRPPRWSRAYSHAEADRRYPKQLGGSMNERIFLGVINLGKPVQVYIDPDQDRLKCPVDNCRQIVMNGRAQRCPTGHPLRS